MAGKSFIRLAPGAEIFDPVRVWPKSPIKFTNLCLNEAKKKRIFPNFRGT
jgi:hypothetical protein